LVLRARRRAVDRDPGTADRRELAVGESYHIVPKTAHRIANRSASETRFLLVQGVGAYDFLRVGG
jgi:hypothetical protein